MPYTIGYSPTRHRDAKIDTGEVPTAAEAWTEVCKLEMSDETIRLIKTPAGREIGKEELKLLAQEEQRPTPPKPK